MKVLFFASSLRINLDKKRSWQLIEGLCERVICVLDCSSTRQRHFFAALCEVSIWHAKVQSGKILREIKCGINEESRWRREKTWTNLAKNFFTHFLLSTPLSSILFNTINNVCLLLQFIYVFYLLFFFQVRDNWCVLSKLTSDILSQSKKNTKLNWQSECGSCIASEMLTQVSCVNSMEVTGFNIRMKIL